MTKKRWIAILLAWLIFVGVYCWVNRKKPVESAPEEDASVKYWVDLVKDGSAEYTVSAANGDYEEIAKEFATLMSQRTGVHFSYCPQQEVRGKMILIGSRPETVMPDVEKLTYHGQVALYTESVIYVTGHHPTAVEKATQRFQRNITEKYIDVTIDDKISVRVPDHFFFLYNPETYLNPEPKLLGRDLGEYRIVFPYETTVTEQWMAEELIQRIGDETGYMMSRVTDTSEPCPKEIVFGRTKRPESTALYSSLPSESYAIRSVGNSVYIAYDNYLVGRDAIDRLLALFASDQESEIDLVETPTYANAMVRKADASHIRVMTTNIVAAGDLDAQATFDEGYGITWAERVAIQADMIMTYLPDFIGLQEMQEHPDINGYEGYMHSVMEENTCTEYSFVIYDDLPRSEYWTPIMYRSTLWQVEAKGFLPCWDNAMHRLQWALFSRIDNPDEKYLLINLHNPTSNRVDWQWKAAQETNELFLRLRDEYGVPIFITGDFNTSYGSNTYEMIVNRTDLMTSQRIVENSGTSGASIDHVFVQQSLMNVEAYRVINNGYISKTSDHRPVFADLSRRAE